MTGLRRHVPQFAIDWMLDAPERLWQAIDGTLCFADISGFTALSERLSRRGRIGGEELVETLSRVFGGMLDTARQRDGSLLKFGGDALLFLFTGDDHAVRAAGAAAEMRRALRRAREIPTSVGPLDLSMSVGLHSGNIHLFLVGSTHRELVLAGPDASQAAVIESSARAGEIGLSAAAAARLPARAVRPRDDGLPLLRWRQAPSPPAGPAPQRPVTEELLWSLFPRALGQVLARGAPEPEHRVACIAFARFSGTDRWLEAQGPESLAEALQATVGAAQDILATEDVTLLAVDLDRDGGKLFLGSGVPQASEDDEGRMLRALRRLADAGTPLPLQIGVNRGHVFAAEVGTPWRAAYSAMGDTTNTAARICAKAPPGAIYAHPSVLARARTKYAVQAEGPFAFKGKKTPQVVYRVGGESAARVGTAADRAARALVGRSAEIRAMSEVTDAFAAGTGGVLLITGAAGLGKSRLLRAALETLGDPRPLLQLRAEPYEATRPYHVFRDAVRGVLGIEGERADVRREQLLSGLARTDPALTPLASLLGDVVQVDVPPSAEVQAIDPKYRQDRIADVLIEVLEGLGTGAQVITVEDAQWADTASARLLDRLAGACATRHWLMLVARREGDGGFEPSEGRRIELGPMPDRDMAALVNAATVTTPLRPDELELVVRRAGGNPLFAEEIVRAGREAGSFEAVPDSLEAALAARVDTLDPEARRVLRYATVLGRSFRLATLQALLSEEGVRLDAGVLSRLGDFLERERDDSIRFRAGLLRKTVYEGLSFRRRLRLHGRAGEVLERIVGDPAEEADALALHFSMAGDYERTWRYARLAGDRAARAYANADAAKLYRTALEAARRLPAIGPEERRTTWVSRGNVCRLAGLFDEALDAYRQAARLAGDDPLVQADLLRLRALARRHFARRGLGLGAVQER